MIKFGEVWPKQAVLNMMILPSSRRVSNMTVKLVTVLPVNRSTSCVRIQVAQILEELQPLSKFATAN